MIKNNLNYSFALPSKGRMRSESEIFFNKATSTKLHKDYRDYFFKIKKFNFINGIYLHSKEIIERIFDGSLDAGISGLDLLREFPRIYQNKIKVFKVLDFGEANLCVAIPNDWIDVQTTADLEEISYLFKDKNNFRIRVATKYPNLTRKFLYSKGITQFKIISSLGATETYPYTGSSEFIVDLVSTGKTLKANNLRVISDGLILKSAACILVSHKSIKKKRFLNFLKKLI